MSSLEMLGDREEEGVLDEVPKLQTLLSNCSLDIICQGPSRDFRLNIKTKILFSYSTNLLLVFT